MFCEYNAKWQHFALAWILKVSCIKLTANIAPKPKNNPQQKGQGRGVPLLLIYIALLLHGKFKREVKEGEVFNGGLSKAKGSFGQKGECQCILTESG